MHEAADTRRHGRREQIARAVDHHPLEPLLAALAHRDEVDDDVATVGRRTELARIGHVPLHQGRAPRFEPGSLAAIPDERAPGVRYQVASRKRSDLACSMPDASDPAIG